MSWKSFLRWLPAVVMMAVLFLASNTPSSYIPNFGILDMVVKKTGHMLGYALLAFTYWYGLGFQRKFWWLALALAILYALTDEYHQSFVSGRHPSLVDVFGFDGGGALLSLLMTRSVIKKRQ